MVKKAMYKKLAAKSVTAILVFLKTPQKSVTRVVSRTYSLNVFMIR